MPIKFRCPHCRQFLGISRSKAGGIADCPMCGKALRVPSLDGTVEPLSSPELDLHDSSLADALGELASIGTPRSMDEQVEETIEEIDAPVVVQPAPRPIELTPLEAAKPLAIAELPLSTSPVVHRMPRKRRTPSGLANATVEGRRDITKGAGPIALPGTPARRMSLSRCWPRWTQLAAAFLLVAAGSGLTIAVDRWIGPSTEGNTADAASVSLSASPAAPPQPEESGAAVTGRVTYLSEAGDTRPDNGARILALPESRKGTVKLDVAGALVGSEEVDSRVAAAALRAMGGDLAATDENGRFAIYLKTPGDYQLVVISRHQSRPWEVGVDDDVLELLETYFIRPSTLLGQLAYKVQPFQYRGRGTSPRDFAFERE
jgi:hypothetical protein